MLNQVTHDPRAVATPSQLKFADARRERLARFERGAISAPPLVPADKTFRPKPLLPPEVVTVPPPPDPWFCLAVLTILARRYEADSGRRPRVDEIIRVVAKSYDVPADDIISFRRPAIIVRPRQVVMYLARTLTLKSLPEIGRAIGGRDHSTVHFSVRKIARLRQEDPALSEQLDTLSHALGGTA